MVRKKVWSIFPFKRNLFEIILYIYLNRIDTKIDFKFNDGKEDHRVFVKHPNTEITRDQINEIFEKCGSIVGKCMKCSLILNQIRIL